MHNSRHRLLTLCLIFFFIFSLTSLFGLGKSEETKQVESVEKPELIVYICDVDISQMPEEQKIVGLRIRSVFVQTLKHINERKRSAIEVARYKEKIWQEQKNTAAKALAEARNNRDMLLFKGYSQQKYKIEYDKMTTIISDLEKKYINTLKQPPKIAETARLVLHKDTAGGIFASGPQSAERQQFCKDRGIDFLLISSLHELFGRWVLSYNIYRSIDNIDIYSDAIAFLPEELETILPNMVSALYEGFSGSPTGAVKVSVEPSSATIALDDVCMGKGITSVIEGPPGTVSVSISHPGYYPLNFSMDRTPNELHTAEVSLTPIAVHAFDIVSSVPEIYDIYIDGLYQGKTPLTIEMPQGNYSMLIVKKSGDQETQSVPLILQTKDGIVHVSDTLLQSQSERPVEGARRKFYNAFGRFWIALPVAYVLNGVANTYINAIYYSENQDLVDPATKWYYSAQAAWLITGVFLIESVYRLGCYLYSANRKSSSVLEPQKN